MPIASETRQTCMRAGMTLALIVGGLAAYALANPIGKPPRPAAAFDAYLWHGTSGAALALQRDLSERFPAGSHAGALLARLERGGFECKVNPAQPHAYDCLYRRSLAFDRVAEIGARVVTDGPRLVGIAAGPEATLLAAPEEPARRRNG